MNGYVVITTFTFMQPHVLVYQEELKDLAEKHYGENVNGSFIYFYKMTNGVCELIKSNEKS